MSRRYTADVIRALARTTPTRNIRGQGFGVRLLAALARNPQRDGASAAPPAKAPTTTTHEGQ